MSAAAQAECPQGGWPAGQAGVPLAAVVPAAGGTATGTRAPAGLGSATGSGTAAREGFPTRLVRCGRSPAGGGVTACRRRAPWGWDARPASGQC